MNFPLEAKLKDGTPIELVLAKKQDIQAVRCLYEVIVKEGTSYPHHIMPGDEEFFEYWFKGKSTIGAYTRKKDRAPTLIGVFYLKPNWPGRAKHVANAGFMVAPDWRNRGLGWLLGATMLDYARTLGYRSVIFNLVFSDNRPARHLWKKLGFIHLGILPGAVYKDDGTYQDSVIMFRSLV